MSELRSAPYPADTRAKGWRFELDYEKIEQSTTWSRAKPEARPWLLMLWMISWKQVPCGSLPDDPEAVAGAIGISDELWDRFQPFLMRGWWRAEDGRLYHDTVSQRVLEMIEYRRKEAMRRAGSRGKLQDIDDCPTDVPRDTRGTTAGHARDTHRTTAGLPRDDTRSPDTGTGTITSQQDKPVEKRRATRLRTPACPTDVDAQVWSDWLELRHRKRAPVTVTVIEGAYGEAAKAGMALEEFLRIWCRRGTQGLEAAWLKPDERQYAMTYKERDAANAAARVHEMTGGLVSAKPAVVITRRNDALQEVFDATPRLVG